MRISKLEKASILSHIPILRVIIVSFLMKHNIDVVIITPPQHVWVSLTYHSSSKHVVIQLLCMPTAAMLCCCMWTMAMFLRYSSAAVNTEL